MSCNWVRFLVVASLLGSSIAGLAAAAEVNLNLNAFDGVWTFDDAGNRLRDISNTPAKTLVVGAGTPAYGAATPSFGGFTPFGAFLQPENPFTPPAFQGNPGPAGSVFQANGGTRIQMPAGMYSGGSFTLAVAAREAAGAPGLSFGTLISSNRFQFHSTDPGGGGTPGGTTNMNYRTAGGAGNSGLDGADLTLSDWNLVILRYTAGPNTLETFIQNSSVLDPTPQVGTVTGAGLGGITTFGFGGDGLSGIGGFDGFTGEIDFILFSNSALSNADLSDLSNFFADGPIPPPPPLAPEPGSIALFGLAVCGMGTWYYRRRRIG